MFGLPWIALGLASCLGLIIITVILQQIRFIFLFIIICMYLRTSFWLRHRHQKSENTKTTLTGQWKQVQKNAKKCKKWENCSK